MSIEHRNDDVFGIQGAAAQEMLKLEEVQEMAANVLQCRSSLPDQLVSTLSSLLDSQRPVSQTRFLNEGPELESESGVSQCVVTNVQSKNINLSATEAEKIRLLNQKISSNASLLPIILKRMEEYMARIDNLASPVETSILMIQLVKLLVFRCSGLCWTSDRHASL